MDYIYKSTGIKAFRTSAKSCTYYQVVNSGSWKKKCKCPRCRKDGDLSFKIGNYTASEAPINFRKYLYVCTSCGHEHEPQFLKKRNEKSLQGKIKAENNNELLVAILKLHNGAGNKDLRQTIGAIEKKVGFVKGWLEKRANQQRYYRPVDREVIDDINNLKDLR